MLTLQNRLTLYCKILIKSNGHFSTVICLTFKRKVLLCRDNYTHLEGLKREQLNVFKTVKEITGYLMVQGGNQAMSDLSFLSNLQIIHGRELDM